MTRYSDLPNDASAYIREGILTESPLGLIARVYEIASLQIARARSAMAQGNLNAKGAAVRQVSRCLSVLQTSLNREDGGEVARNLDRIYTYLFDRLNQAHMHNDDAIFAEVARHVAELGGAWRQAAETWRPTPDASARPGGSELAVLP